MTEHQVLAVVVAAEPVELVELEVEDNGFNQNPYGKNTPAT